MFSLPSNITFFERGWLSSNNVLIQDEEQAILIDSGYWTHAQQTASLVMQTLNPHPLTGLINTHLHSDHCGGNAYLQDLFPKLQTWIPPGHSAYVDDWDANVLTYTPTGQHCPKFRKTGVLHNGDQFVIADKTWRVYAAPGHDPHSIVIFNEEDRLLISADALWENGFGVVFPEIEGFSAFSEVESTLNIIEELGPKLVIPGHGAIFSDVSGSLVRARTRLLQFRNAPDKHASYAAKVLLKFKLLELQEVKSNDFLNWGISTHYLHLLHEQYSGDSEFESWFMALCRSLEKSGACTIKDGLIANI